MEIASFPQTMYAEGLPVSTLQSGIVIPYV